MVVQMYNAHRYLYYLFSYIYTPRLTRSRITWGQCTPASCRGWPGSSNQVTLLSIAAICYEFWKVETSGGMFIYGDHVGTWGLYHQLRVMEDCGFQDIDVAWRHQAFFVAGGRSRAAESLHWNSEINTFFIRYMGMLNELRINKWTYRSRVRVFAGLGKGKPCPDRPSHKWEKSSFFERFPKQLLCILMPLIRTYNFLKAMFDNKLHAVWKFETLVKRYWISVN